MNRSQRLQSAKRWLESFEGENVIRAYRKRKLEKQRLVREAEWNNRYPLSDENFYFIAGYTSGGAPYGITCEQAKRDGLLEDRK